MLLPESILGVLDYSYILSFWRNHKIHKLNSCLKRTKECVFLRKSTKKNETSWQDIIRSSSSHHSCIYQLCKPGQVIPLSWLYNNQDECVYSHGFSECTTNLYIKNLECWSRQIPTYAPSKLFQDRNLFIPLVLCLIFLCYPYLILTSKSARKRV